MGISRWQDAEREELEVALKNCGERWATEVKQLQAQLARLRREVMAQTNRAVAMNEENARLTERVRHHAEALNEVEAERDRLREELEAQRDRAWEATSAVIRYQDENARLRAELREERVRHCDTLNALDQAEDEIRRLRRREDDR